MKQPKGESSAPKDRVSGDQSKVSKKALKLQRLKELLASKQAQKLHAEPRANDKANKVTVRSAGQPKQLTAMQKEMQKKLSGARFRWINEAMYTETGAHTYAMVQADPEIFAEYHRGFAEQARRWPENPIDAIIAQLRERSRVVVADLGCGEARLAAELGTQHAVHSFDLVAHNEHVTACNIANVPLDAGSVDVAVFCLALMGTDFMQFIREANRILRVGGELKIAEVVSRVADVDAFVGALEEQGFRLDRRRASKMFIMLDLTKISKHPAKLRAVPGLLKPCIYKRR
ncbi:25S rRNA (adenine645-N1)-methyltransferase [Coemansia sp. RSA 2702]|nr:25S rRNA (adenine645-N1)-methyltransferase [Coemansia sp. RSA 2704]KAJ2318033.1 25S rRNA (adenine645-N1)-methyltransferase [Coemansia sp. RSA 2702]KAJ2717996.1 25S rRNA (adenine645-N1)-methyltransferase [Coemansia sp. Cherry 401B]